MIFVALRLGDAIVHSNAQPGSTRFASLKPWSARLVLLAFLAIVIWGAVFSGATSGPGKAITQTSQGDVELYRSIVGRLHEGESYYDVVASELRSRGYATRPFFNWRLPTLACFLAVLPSAQIGMWVLAGLASLALALWLDVLKKDGGFYMALLGGGLLLGIVASCLAESEFLFHELWAGVLIALSIAAWARNRWLSVTAGLLALFIRELSFPFVVVMMIVAYKEKHRSEAIAWSVGIGAFFLFLSVHAKIVSGLLTDADISNASWVQFGGWSFVLATAKWNSLTLFTPWWIDVVLLPLTLIGLIGWRGPIATRLALTSVLYVLAFLIAGRSDNFYWGMLYAPLLALGVLHIPRSLADLSRSAIGIRK